MCRQKVGMCRRDVGMRRRDVGMCKQNVGMCKQNVGIVSEMTGRTWRKVAQEIVQRVLVDDRSGRRGGSAEGGRGLASRVDKHTGSLCHHFATLLPIFFQHRQGWRIGRAMVRPRECRQGCPIRPDEARTGLPDFQQGIGK